MLERFQQERPETAPSRVGDVEVLLLQQAGEKFLGQILRVLPAVPLPAHVGVEGIPVDATQTRQGDLGLRRRQLSGRQHHAPMRGLEAPGLVRAWNFTCFLDRHVIAC